MSAATDRWRETRQFVPHDAFVKEAGDTLAAILDRIEREALDWHAGKGHANAAMYEVLRIVQEESP